MQPRLHLPLGVMVIDGVSGGLASELELKLQDTKTGCITKLLGNEWSNSPPQVRHMVPCYEYIPLEQQRLDGDAALAACFVGLLFYGIFRKL